MPEVSSVSINTIRTFCMDAVQQANSGHPVTPMAMAPVVYTLWQDYLRFDSEDPIWPNLLFFERLVRIQTQRNSLPMPISNTSGLPLVASENIYAPRRSPEAGANFERSKVGNA